MSELKQINDAIKALSDMIITLAEHQNCCGNYGINHQHLVDQRDYIHRIIDKPKPKHGAKERP